MMLGVLGLSPLLNADPPNIEFLDDEDDKIIGEFRPDQYQDEKIPGKVILHRYNFNGEELSDSLGDTHSSCNAYSTLEYYAHGTPRLGLPTKCNEAVKAIGAAKSLIYPKQQQQASLTPRLVVDEALWKNYKQTARRVKEHANTLRGRLSKDDERAPSASYLETTSKLADLLLVNLRNYAEQLKAPENYVLPKSALEQLKSDSAKQSRKGLDVSKEKQGPAAPKKPQKEEEDEDEGDSQPKEDVDEIGLCDDLDDESCGE